MALGFKVLQRERVVSPEMIEKFRKIPVANISDSMHRLSAGGPRLRPYHGGGVLCGAAVTVKSRPGDNMMAYMALTMARPGDVIVVDAGGDLTNAIIGERMMVQAERRGFAGFVINGAIRDLEWCKRNRFPVFAAGVTHRGPSKAGPGEVNVPIAIDGMVIAPGDLILGDSDGVLSVPMDEAEAIYARACAKLEAETKQMSAIAAGTNDRSWVDATLRKLGCAMPQGI